MTRNPINVWLHFLRFDVVKLVTMKSAVFSDVIPCSLVDV
jgi:hypothetical protein